MNPPTAEKLQELLSQGRYEHAVTLLQRLDPDVAVDLVMGIPFEEQQILFRALPVDFAATLVNRFPYYHSYVLLHSRPAEELRAIIGKTKPDERHQFFDELPEEAWQHLMDELSGEQPAEAAGWSSAALNWGQLLPGPLRRSNPLSRPTKLRRVLCSRTADRFRSLLPSTCVWSPTPSLHFSALLGVANPPFCEFSPGSHLHPAARSFGMISR